MLLLVGPLAAFAALGGLGVYRYVDNFWVYRGFAPPQDPAFVTQRGSAVRFYIRSAALAGRSQPVDVYLPPGYNDQPLRRYPVLYLLHGFPGKPGAFLLTVGMGMQEDTLVAEQRMQPVILVMPFGSTGTFTDKEWADGIGADDGWETFVARDLVHAIDARYRTLATGSARAIGGLSEGGYGALNIGLHHPREFSVLESWSGYERAQDVPSIFGRNAALLAYNSPQLYLARAAAALRRNHAYLWFYSGSRDPLARQNRIFAAALARQRIKHRFFLVPGGHTWAVWRDHARQALLAAGAHLTHG